MDKDYLIEQARLLGYHLVSNEDWDKAQREYRLLVERYMDLAAATRSTYVPSQAAFALMRQDYEARLAEQNRQLEQQMQAYLRLYDSKPAPVILTGPLPAGE